MMISCHLSLLTAIPSKSYSQKLKINSKSSCWISLSSSLPREQSFALLQKASILLHGSTLPFVERCVQSIPEYIDLASKVQTRSNSSFYIRNENQDKNISVTSSQSTIPSSAVLSSQLPNSFISTNPPETSQVSKNNGLEEEIKPSRPRKRLSLIDMWDKFQKDKKKNPQTTTVSSPINESNLRGTPVREANEQIDDKNLQPFGFQSVIRNVGRLEVDMMKISSNYCTEDSSESMPLSPLMGTSLNVSSTSQDIRTLPHMIRDSGLFQMMNGDDEASHFNDDDDDNMSETFDTPSSVIPSPISQSQTPSIKLKPTVSHASYFRQYRSNNSNNTNITSNNPNDENADNSADHLPLLSICNRNFDTQDGLIQIFGRNPQHLLLSINRLYLWLKEAYSLPSSQEYDPSNISTAAITLKSKLKWSHTVQKLVFKVILAIQLEIECVLRALPLEIKDADHLNRIDRPFFSESPHVPLLSNSLTIQCCSFPSFQTSLKPAQTHGIGDIWWKHYCSLSSKLMKCKEYTDSLVGDLLKQVVDLEL
eukprot:TRINITY_DN26523_c0_g1_i1.p1 TRINITY_DN26523_c0_g1~~TRINITY_DN26523_c0_g1_i1.p1  ORF type:complete len:537 (-),score=118.44 TRINITY_DN26523_c0_g1_i1:137-1747(-)